MPSRLRTSRRARLERILERDPRPSFTFAQLIDRYRSAYQHDLATHDDLTSAFGALIHDGTVARSGLAPGRTRWATRYVFVGRGAPEPNEDLPAMVFAIVEGHYAAERCPIATGSVREALRARGVWPDRFNGLHTMLRVLSESGRLRRASGLSTSRIPTAFWLPGTAPDQCALTPANATEALRRCISAAATTLGRPVSKREIGVWLHAQPGASPLRRSLRVERVSSVLRNVRDREAAHRSCLGRVHVVRGRLTCHGGSPERYSLGDTDSDDIALCRFLDALYAVRPAAELSSIERLSQARLSRGPLFEELASVRRAALRTALRSYVGCDDRDHVHDLAERARRNVSTTASWLDNFSGSYASRRRRDRPLEQTLADIDAVERIWREHDGSRHDHPIVFVGKSGLASVAQVRKPVQEAIATGTLSVNRPQLAYRYARRFPNPLVDDTSSPDQLSAIDYVDGFVEAWSHATDPAARDMAKRAHALIGHVLRDATVLSSLTARIPERDASARAAIHVAIGLLTTPFSQGSRPFGAADTLPDTIFSGVCFAAIRTQ